MHKVVFKWDEGTCVQDYADAATKWTDYTERPEFVSCFQKLVEDNTCTNEARAARVEAFILEEALAAGVVKKV